MGLCTGDGGIAKGPNVIAVDVLKQTTLPADRFGQSIRGFEETIDRHVVALQPITAAVKPPIRIRLAARSVQPDTGDA